MSLPPLALKFLRGAQKVIEIGGYDATLYRVLSSEVDPNDPNAEPVSNVEMKNCRVFVDEPKTKYIDGGMTQLGDGYLYVDHLSIDGNDETRIKWVPKNGDILQRPDGRTMRLSNVVQPEALMVPVTTEAIVTFTMFNLPNLKSDNAEYSVEVTEYEANVNDIPI